MTPPRDAPQDQRSHWVTASMLQHMGRCHDCRLIRLQGSHYLGLRGATKQGSGLDCLGLARLVGKASRFCVRDRPIIWDGSGKQVRTRAAIGFAGSGSRLHYGRYRKSQVLPGAGRQKKRESQGLIPGRGTPRHRPGTRAGPPRPQSLPAPPDPARRAGAPPALPFPPVTPPP